MKKLLHITLATLAFTLIGTVDAKIMKRRTPLSQTVPVTKNEKQMFVDTKALKNASTQQEKMDAAEKLAADIKNNPSTLLILKEQILLDEITELENKIRNEEGYISYFDAKEIIANKKQLEGLYQELTKIETQLGKTTTTRPKAVNALNNWSVGALIGAVGLATAYLLVNNSAAIMSGASTLGGKLGSAASTAWGYVPSWRSTPSPALPSTSTEIPTETTGGFVSNAKWLAGAAGGLAVSIAWYQAKQYAIQKTIGTLMNYILGAEENPETVDPEALQKAKYELEELQQQNKALEKQIASMKAQQQ